MPIVENDVVNIICKEEGDEVAQTKKTAMVELFNNCNEVRNSTAEESISVAHIGETGRLGLEESAEITTENSLKLENPKGEETDLSIDEETTRNQLDKNEERTVPIKENDVVNIICKQEGDEVAQTKKNSYGRAFQYL